MDNWPACSVVIPEWAEWLAQDGDGTWWAYEHEPNQSHSGWYENEVGRSLRLCQEVPNPSWKQALVRCGDSTKA